LSIGKIQDKIDGLKLENTYLRQALQRANIRIQRLVEESKTTKADVNNVKRNVEGLMKNRITEAEVNSIKKENEEIKKHIVKQTNKHIADVKYIRREMEDIKKTVIVTPKESVAIKATTEENNNGIPAREEQLPYTLEDLLCIGNQQYVVCERNTTVLQIRTYSVN